MSKKSLLTEADFVRAAKNLGAPVAAVKAVLEVEAPRGGFQADGQVSILFERHKFSKHTRGRFDKKHPDISNPIAGAYGPYSIQHAKLARAAALDREAALMSASWGKPQILGSNWAEAGAESLQDFMNKMHESEGSQLDLFVGFIKANKTRWNALKALNWAEFARLYNGSNYRRFKYDTKLAAAYKKFSGATV